MPNQEDRIGALWARVSRKGTSYFSGELHGAQIVVFANSRKDNDKQPDWFIFRSTPPPAQEPL